MNVVLEVLMKSKSFAIDLVIDLLIKLADGIITDEQVKAVGVKMGKLLTDNARKAMGDRWESIEELVQDKGAFFFEGLDEGLNYDDK